MCSTVTAGGTGFAKRTSVVSGEPRGLSSPGQNSGWTVRARVCGLEAAVVRHLAGQRVAEKTANS